MRKFKDIINNPRVSDIFSVFARLPMGSASIPKDIADWLFQPVSEDIKDINREIAAAYNKQKALVPKEYQHLLK